MRIRTGQRIITAAVTLGAPVILTVADQTILTLSVVAAQVGDVLYLVSEADVTNLGVASNVTFIHTQLVGTNLVVEGTVDQGAGDTFAQGAAQAQHRGLFHMGAVVEAGDFDVTFRARTTVVNGDRLEAGATFKYLLQRFVA